MRGEKETIHIGNVTLTLEEAEETLSAIRAGRIDAVVVEGAAGNEIYTFRDPSHPFRLLVEAMNEGAVLTTLDGIICYQNPWFTDLVGMDAMQVRSRSLAELVVPEQRAELASLLDRARTGPARGNVELIGNRERLVPAQLSVSRASLADVEVFCVVVTDLTEQRRQEELYRAARLEIEARDRLFSVAAHELRNPLTVLELKAQLLATLLEESRAGAPLSVENAAGIVARLRAQAARIGELVTKLLDVGSIGAGRMRLSREEIDLADVVRAVVDRSQDQIERSTSSLELALHPVRGRWDRVRLEQVVENLVSNALKYGLGCPIRVFVEGGDEVARVGVEDEGRGIPEEARDRIFRPYERMGEAEADAVPGLGIGLFVTAEIVKAHGGSIRVEGRPNRGSRFVVELPLDGPSGGKGPGRGGRS
jgi:PAS domain S-box-containing protein